MRRASLLSENNEMKTIECQNLLIVILKVFLTCPNIDCHKTLFTERKLLTAIRNIDVFGLAEHKQVHTFEDVTADFHDRVAKLTCNQISIIDAQSFDCSHQKLHCCRDLRPHCQACLIGSYKSCGLSNHTTKNILALWFHSQSPQLLWWK